MQNGDDGAYQLHQPIRNVAKFYFRAIESLITGEGITAIAQREPELFDYLLDSIMLEKYGDAAFKLRDMPIESEVWRNEMRLIAVISKQVDYKMHFVSKKDST